jgi:hypothetical protein
LNRDIKSVAPSPAEPEGQVFEIMLANQQTYKLAAQDGGARRWWINFIEEKTKSKDVAKESQKALEQPSLPTSPKFLRFNSSADLLTSGKQVRILSLISYSSARLRIRFPDCCYHCLCMCNHLTGLDRCTTKPKCATRAEYRLPTLNLYTHGGRCGST